MNILVIGSKGFVGSACCRIFGKQNEVTGADIHPLTTPNYFRIENSGSFETLFASKKYDVCINASGSANVGFSFTHPEKDRELNVVNVQHILDAIAKHQPACRFINFSSAAVYGNPVSLPIDESFDVAPLSPYGMHKLESEQLLREYHKNGLKTISLRVFSAYGPGLHKQLFWDIFQKRQLSPEVRLFGTGNESRDFIYIDDLVQAISCVIDSAPFHGEVINVASGIETTIHEAATTFLDALGNDYSLTFTGEVKPGDPVNWRASIEFLKNLGFTPATKLRFGLGQTAQEYIEASRH